MAHPSQILPYDIPASPAPLPHLLFVMNSPVIGGAELHTFDLAASLRGRGFRTSIFAMKAGPVGGPEGIPLLQPDAPRSLANRIGDLARTIRAVDPDIMVAVNERPVFTSYVSRLLARKHVPIVGIYHSTLLQNRWEELMQVVYKPIFNRIDSVVFISRNQHDFWRMRGFAPRHEAIILNGVDLDHYSPAVRDRNRMQMRAELGLTDEEIVVGLCAVMRPEKNHLQLVEAIARLRQRGVPAKALLVGDGPMRSALEQRAATLGLADAVIRAGMHWDVRPFLSAFDVGVICSTSVETLSLAALEVMAMGIPMVMSEIGGAAEIIDGINGRLFKAGDDDGLCQALLTFRAPGPRRAAGKAARRTVEERFDREAMLRSYFRFFAERPWLGNLAPT